jgi:hypothetical protein
MGKFLAKKRAAQTGGAFFPGADPASAPRFSFQHKRFVKRKLTVRC